MQPHRLYVQNGRVSLDRAAYYYLGCRNFLWTADLSREDFAAHYDAIRTWFTDVECDIVHIREDHAWRIRPGRQERAPIWRIGRDDVDKLYDILDTGPETIYIENRPGTASGAWRFPTEAEKFAERRLLEAVAEYQFVEFISYGPFSFKLSFQSGLAGAAITMRKRRKGDLTGNVCYDYAPDGVRIKQSELKRALHIAGRYQLEMIRRIPGVVHVDAEIVRGVMLAQCAAEYQQKLIKIELDQKYDAVKLLPDNWFPDDMEYNEVEGVITGKRNLLSVAIKGDRVTCNTCSLKYRCPLYKSGSVCAVPNTDGKTLTDYFGTRDVEDILGGMQALLRKQAQRVEAAVEAEESAIEAAKKENKPVLHSRDVTHMLGELQKNSERYLKLVDPRFTKPVVQINNNNGALPPAEARDIDPATARDELVERGIPLEQITPSVIQRYLEGGWSNDRELMQANVIEGDLANDF